MAISDLIAVGVINEAEQRGITVGRDVSLIGYDNAPLGQYLHPPLTTLEQPLEQIAREVIARLCDLIVRQPINGGRHVLVPPHLIMRASVGAPPE